MVTIRYGLPGRADALGTPSEDAAAAITAPRSTKFPSVLIS